MTKKISRYDIFFFIILRILNISIFKQSHIILFIKLKFIIINAIVKIAKGSVKMKKKNIKYFIIIGVVFAIFAIVVIFLNPFRIIANERKAVARDLLNKKYNETFVIKSYSKGQLINDYYIVTGYSESNPDIIFEASVNEDGEAVSDNYWAKCISNQLSNQISNDISSQGENYVYSKLLIDDVYQTDTSMSLSECAEKNILSDFTIYVFVNNNFNASKLYEDLETSLEDKTEIKGKFKIYKTDSKTIEKVKKYLTTHSDADSGLNQIIKSSTEVNLKFSNGLIEESKNSFMDKIGY